MKYKIHYTVKTKSHTEGYAGTFEFVEAYGVSRDLCSEICNGMEDFCVSDINLAHQYYQLLAKDQTNMHYFDFKIVEK